jgi:SNF2 family DNA or RNA helicase
MLDEPHCLQGERSKRVQALLAFRDHPQIMSANGLTGSPLTGKPKTLFTLVNVLSPDRFGKRREGEAAPSFYNFGMRYCAGYKEQVTLDKVVYKYEGISNAPELKRRLQFFTLRRTKQSVGMQLPPKTRQVIDLEVPVRARIMPGADTLKKSPELRRHLDLAADAKLPQVIDLVYEQASSGHRVVVFTYRKRVAEMICNAMTTAGLQSTYVHGELPIAKREKRLNEARASAEGHVLTATIDTVSTAIDLTYADVGVFAELSWEAWKLAQAEARLNRPGQTRNMQFLYPIARCTADELILHAVISKLSAFDSIVGPSGDGMLQALDAAPKGQEALDQLYKAVVKMQQAASKKRSP